MSEPHPPPSRGTNTCCPPEPLKQTKPPPVTAPHLPKEAGAIKTPFLGCQVQTPDCVNVEGPSELTRSKPSFYQGNPERGHTSSRDTQPQGSWRRPDTHYGGILPISMTSFPVSCSGGPPPPVWTRDPPPSIPMPSQHLAASCLCPCSPLSEQCPCPQLSIYPDLSNPPKSTPDLTHVLQELPTDPN